MIAVTSPPGAGENGTDTPLRVGYLLHRFPHLTETFIMNEMKWIRSEGVALEIFSLLSPGETIVHREAQEMLPAAHYRPFLSREVLRDQGHFLQRLPRRYLLALARVIRQTWREPMVLARALLLFPKSVSFAREIEALGLDHLHAHFVWTGALAAGVVADLLDIPFTIFPHAFGLFGRNQQDVRIQLEHASQIVTISTYHAAYIANLCPHIPYEDVAIVYYGVDTELFCPPPERESQEPVQILGVGRLIRKKGFEVLIAACQMLAERGVPFNCQIVGSGPRRRALQAQIAEAGLDGQVTLCGALHQDAVRALYQQSDIFALPCVSLRGGDQDGLPYVLMEAMSCGLPVVTTPVAGIPDLVHLDENGLLVPQRDPVALAGALERLILNPVLRQQLGACARQTVLDEFDVRAAVRTLAALFRRVAAKPEQPQVKVRV